MSSLLQLVGWYLTKGKAGAAVNDVNFIGINFEEAGDIVLCADGVGDNAVSGADGASSDELEVSLKSGWIVAVASEGDEVVNGDYFFEGGASPGNEKGGTVKDVDVKLGSERDEAGIFPYLAGGVFFVIGVDLDGVEVIGVGELGGHVIVEEDCV